MMRRLYGIAVGCLICGERATHMVLTFPMCEKHAKEKSS